MNQKLQKAIEAIESNDKESAYRLLVEVIKKDPKSKDAESAWIWLSTVIDDPQKKRMCLQTAFDMNPKNALARERLSDLDTIILLKGSQPTIEKSAISTQKPSQPSSVSMPPWKQRSLLKMIGVGFAIFVWCVLSMILIYFGQSENRSEASQLMKLISANELKEPTNQPTPRQRSTSTPSIPIYMQMRFNDVDEYLSSDPGIPKLDWDVIYIVQDGDYISRNFVIPDDCHKMVFDWYLEDAGSISIELTDASTGRTNFIDLGFAIDWKDNSGSSSEYIRAGIYYLEIQGPWDGWQVSAHCLDNSWYE